MKFTYKNIQKIEKSDKVVVRSYIFVDHVDECGQDITDKAFYVKLKTAYGTTYDHCAYGFDKKEDAEKLADKIKKVGEINLEHWQIGRDSYGSQAYLDNNGDSTELELEIYEENWG